VTKTHVTIISLLLGLAVVLGLAAAVRTTGLAGQQATASAGALGARQQRLDRLNANLRHALASRPPALPAIATAPATTAPRIRFVRPSPIEVPSSSFEEHDDHGDDGGHGDDERYEGFDD
jgi:hypothetical protein